MLFSFDIAVNALASVPVPVLASVVSELARARRMGHHLVVIRPDVASWLKDHLDLSTGEKAMISRIGEDFTQTGGLRRRATVFISIVANVDHHFTFEGNAIRVAIHRADDYRLFERSVLVVENAGSDGKMYQAILLWLSRHFKVGQVELEVAHGGGSDLPVVFRQKIDEKRIVLAVVDSDRYSPKSSLQKVESLRTRRTELGWPLSFVSSPPCREVENLLPLEIMMLLPCGNGNRANSVHLRINRAETDNNCHLTERFWLFVDLKNAISKENVTGLLPDERQWIVDKLALGNVGLDGDQVQGYGETIVEQLFREGRVVAALNKAIKHPAWLEVFSSFIEELLWIFVASERLRT